MTKFANALEVELRYKRNQKLGVCFEVFMVFSHISNPIFVDILGRGHTWTTAMTHAYVFVYRRGCWG